jgi:hypothetical protein
MEEVHTGDGWDRYHRKSMDRSINRSVVFPDLLGLRTGPLFNATATEMTMAFK